MGKTVTNATKSDFWQIEVLQRRFLEVVFTDPVTSNEAYDLISDEEYEDIIDTEDMEVQSYLGAKPLGDNVID